MVEDLAEVCDVFFRGVALAADLFFVVWADLADFADLSLAGVCFEEGEELDVAEAVLGVLAGAIDGVDEILVTLTGAASLVIVVTPAFPFVAELALVEALLLVAGVSSAPSRPALSSPALRTPAPTIRRHARFPLGVTMVWRLIALVYAQ